MHEASRNMALIEPDARVEVHPNRLSISLAAVVQHMLVRILTIIFKLKAATYLGCNIVNRQDT